METPIPKAMERVFDVVARSDNLAADAAFAEALPHLSEPLQLAAAKRVLERGNSNGLTALVGDFGNYAASVQSVLVGQVDRLFGAARACMSSEVPAARLSAVALIEASNECRLAYLLSGALTRRCPRTRTAAATALLSMTQRAVKARAGAASPDARRSAQRHAVQLADALAIGLDGWQAHHRTEVLAASMWLCDLMERTLFEKASLSRMHVARALNELLRAADGEFAAAYALRALSHPDLRAAAVREIASRQDAPFVSRLLEEAWVTLHPENAKACSWVRQFPSAAFQTLSGQQARNAVRLVRLSGLGLEAKLTIYRRMIFGGAPELQESALWQITELDAPGATDVFSRVAAWNTEPLSGIASRELFRRDPQRRAQSSAESGAEAASGSESPQEDSFATYWDRFDVMDDQERVAEGRSLRARARAFADRLGDQLHSRDAEDRLRALRIVRVLTLAADFQDQICALSHDAESKVRSLAVAMLSQLEGATAARILRQALNDPDDRVQANAVEALAELSGRSEVESLARKLEAEHQRVRANAVKALLAHRHRRAAVVLIGMLQHAGAAHRMSALWVVEQLGLTTLAPRERHLAQNDPDARVRERAWRVLSETLAASPALPVASAEGSMSP